MGAFSLIVVINLLNRKDLNKSTTLSYERLRTNNALLKAKIDKSMANIERSERKIADLEAEIRLLRSRDCSQHVLKKENKNTLGGKGEMEKYLKQILALTDEIK